MILSPPLLSSFLENITDLTGKELMSQETVEVVPLDNYDIHNINTWLIERLRGYTIQPSEGRQYARRKHSLSYAWMGTWYFQPFHC